MRSAEILFRVARDGARLSNSRREINSEEKETAAILGERPPEQGKACVCEKHLFRVHHSLPGRKVELLDHNQEKGLLEITQVIGDAPLAAGEPVSFQLFLEG